MKEMMYSTDLTSCIWSNYNFCAVVQNYLENFISLTLLKTKFKCKNKKILLSVVHNLYKAVTKCLLCKFNKKRKTFLWMISEDFIIPQKWHTKHQRLKSVIKKLKTVKVSIWN